MQHRVAGTDLHPGNGERPVPPDRVQLGADLVDLVRGGQRAHPDGADRPLGIEHVHGLLGPQTLGSVGVDGKPCAASAGAAGPASAQPQARATTSATAAVSPVARSRAWPALRLGAGPATSNTTSNSNSDAPVATGFACWPACASTAGPVAHAWNASSDSHCVTTK